MTQPSFGGSPPRIAAFVSPHGFGHAARASAIMAAAHRQAGAEFEIFSTVPEWFFDESLPGSYAFHEVECDVGFRQRSALAFDVEATVAALNDLLPYDEDRIEECAEILRSRECRAALCDISPFGVAVAESAGVPSLLVESFSWPWLYEPLFEEAPTLRRLSVELDQWSEQATVHLQTEPLCSRDPRYELLDPISREPTLDREAARASLELDPDGTVVVITMGGYSEPLTFLERLQGVEGVTFVVTGVGSTERVGNLHLYDNHTPLFMPNVLRAADGIVAKLGYGIVAEVWREGLPFAQVTRPDSRETPPLEDFARDELSGFPLEPDAFQEGDWIGRIPELVSMPRRPRPDQGGAGRAAEVLLGLG